MAGIQYSYIMPCSKQGLLLKIHPEEGRSQQQPHARKEGSLIHLQLLLGSSWRCNILSEHPGPIQWQPRCASHRLLPISLFMIQPIDNQHPFLECILITSDIPFLSASSSLLASLPTSHQMAALLRAVSKDTRILKTTIAGLTEAAGPSPLPCGAVVTISRGASKGVSPLYQASCEGHQNEGKVNILQSIKKHSWYFVPCGIESWLTVFLRPRVRGFYLSCLLSCMKCHDQNLNNNLYDVGQGPPHPCFMLP